MPTSLSHHSYVRIYNVHCTSYTDVLLFEHCDGQQQKITRIIKTDFSAPLLTFCNLLHFGTAQIILSKMHNSTSVINNR